MKPDDVKSSTYLTERFILIHYHHYSHLLLEHFTKKNCKKQIKNDLELKK